MTQDQLYEQACAEYGPALDRLARSYEADPDRRRDLLQEIHLATWKSFRGFEGQCSLRTWIYRVAHNVSASHVIRDRRTRSWTLVSLEELESHPETTDTEEVLDRQKTIEQLHALIQKLKPLDREIILLYLEGLDGAAIGEITGISPANAAVKVHRIKRILATRFKEGGRNEQ